MKYKHSCSTWAWITWYMFPVVQWKVNNQSSNSTSCSDNTLRLLVLVASILNRELQVMSSSFSIWDCVLKGCFEREVYFEGPNHVWRASKTSTLSTDRNMQHGGCAESHAVFLPRLHSPFVFLSQALLLSRDLTSSTASGHRTLVFPWPPRQRPF